MSQDAEFRERIQRIGALVKRLDSIPDPSLHAAAKELIQSVMDLHGAAVERTLEIVAGSEEGTATIDSLGDDPLVGSLLLLYGVHPLDFETRVLRAIAKLQSLLRGYGGKANLVSSNEGELCIQVHGIGSASAAKAARAAIEEEIYTFAPDLASLEIRGLEQFAAGDFVPIEKLIAISSSRSFASPEAAKGAI
jgi:hypothetical protein